MLNIREEFKSDLLDFFERVNTDYYLKEYNDDNENMIYFIKDNCSNLYRPWSGDLWRDKNNGIFSSVIFDIFAVKYKSGYKLVFSNAKYKQFLQHEFIKDIFPVIACSYDTSAPQLIAYWYGIDNYAICYNGDKLQAYKVHTTPSGKDYIKTKYRRYYLNTYIKL